MRHFLSLDHGSALFVNGRNQRRLWMNRVWRRYLLSRDLQVKPLISLQRSVVAIGVRWTLYWIVPLVLPPNCPGILRGEE
jgi:hypothetical protein